MPSGAVTVGGLVINMAADTAQLKSDMAEGARVVDSSAKSMINSMAGITESSGYATDAGQRLVRQLKEEIATFGMTSQQLTQHKANLNGAGAEVEVLISRLNAMHSAQASFGQDVDATSAALRGHGAAASEAGGHVEGFGFKTAAAKRELLVLAHELSQGNYKRFGGSMLVLGEQTGAAGLLFSSAGLAALGLGAAVVGVSAALIKGAEDQRAMSNALIATGNYAGTTSDSLDAMAHAAVAAGGSIGEAKKAVTELAASGKFTGAQIGMITDAAVALEHSGGQSIDKTIEAFQALAVETTGSSARSSEAISKAAVKLDEQYHFLTESIYEQIRALEKEGDQKAASALATETLAKVTKQRAEEMQANIGAIQRGWNSVKETIGEVIDGLGRVGMKNTAATDAAKASAKLVNFDDGLKAVGVTDPEHQLTGSWAETRRKLVLDLVAAYDKLNQADAAAIEQGRKQTVQQEAVIAASRIEQDNMRLGKKGLSELDDAIQKYGQDLAKIAEANPGSQLLNQDAVNEHMALLIKAHTQAAKGNDDRAQLLQGALTVEQTALDRERSIYDARAKMLDVYHSKFGMSDAEFYADREAARAEYVDAEAISFAREAALIATAQAQARNPQEVAAAKEKYDQLVKAHTKFVDDMRNGRGQDSVDAEAATKKSYDDLMKGITDTGDAQVKSLDDQIAKQKEHNAEIGKTKEQIEQARQAQAKAAAEDMQREATAIDALLNQADLQGILVGKDRDLYAARLAYLNINIGKEKELANLRADGANAEAAAKAAASLDKFLDPTKADAFGKSLKGALGGAADSMSKLTRLLQVYGANQAKIAEERGNAALLLLNGKKTESEYLDTVYKLNQRNTEEQLNSYGNMASAAAGFFGEHSRGYQSMMAVSRVFHAAELAMEIKNMVTKSGLLTAFTGLFVASKATQTAAEGSATGTSVTMAGTQASAWGITAVVKAIASMPFPLNLAAGAATLAAVVAVGAKMFGSVGGSGQSVSLERQAAQGTGTVLGDSSAKSESIARAIELSASNSSTQINYLSGMLTALRSIQSNITSFASEVLRTTDVTNPNVGSLNTNNGFATTLMKGGMTAVAGMAGAGLAAFTTMASVAGPLGMAAAYLVAKIPVVSNLLGKIGTSILGGKQSLNDSGITMDKASLADILANGVNAKSYADITTSGGWFRSDKHDTKTSALGADADQQFTTIIKSLADGVKQAGVLLGMNGDVFAARLNTFVVDIGKISLKELKGDDLQKALESVFSKLGDQMAQFGVAGLQQFQKVGEGYLETLVRVASDYAKVDASLQSIGKTFGATGVSSIAARESLIDLLGGIDDFQSKTADYATNFLTKAQQLAPVAAYVSQQLTSMNLGWVQTREQFAGVVAGLDLTTAAGQQTYAALMNLESAFAATHEAIADATKSAQEISDERKALQGQLDQLTMTSAQLLAKQRDALDDSNKALFDQVQAAKKVKDAQDAAKTSLGNFVNQMKSFATTAKGLNNSLALGSLSTLTPMQQYAEARRQFEQTRQQAAAGDATAQGNLQSIEQTFLQLSQKINGGDSQYSSDLATVMQANDQMAKWAAQSVDVAQASLDALNDSSATLTDMSATLSTIAQSVQYLPAALAGQDVPIYAKSPAQIDYSRMGSMDMAPLVAEVKALREEVKGLRAEALKRTGDLIQAGEASAEKAAGIVVEGVRNAATDSAWAASNSKRTLS